MTLTPHCLFQKVFSHFFLIFGMCFSPSTHVDIREDSKASLQGFGELGIAFLTQPLCSAGSPGVWNGKYSLCKHSFPEGSCSRALSPSRRSSWQQQMLECRSQVLCQNAKPCIRILLCSNRTQPCIFIFKNQLFTPDFPGFCKAFRLKIQIYLV